MKSTNRRWELPVPGDPGKYVFDFRVDYPGEMIAYLARVSSKQQGKRGNLLWQERILRKAIVDAGGEPLQIPSEEWSGHGEEWLAKLFVIGIELRSKGIGKLLFHNLSRLIRSRSYVNTHPKWKQARPTETEIREAFEALGEGVEPMTLMSPNASPDEILKEMSTRGTIEKGNAGGRPIVNKLRYKAKWKPAAVKYKQEHPNVTLDEITQRINYLSGRSISSTSIWNWLNGK